MAPRTIFANLTDGLQSLSLFDTMFSDTGNWGIIPCTAVGTNTVALTPLTTAYAPTPAYNNYNQFSFVAVHTSTGAVTINVNGLGALNAYKADGVTAVGSGDIVFGGFYQIAYSSALNSGAGGFFMGESIDLSPANFGNPTATIGLTAVNGSALTALRSDGAPPLSQAIVPAWTGLHTFNAGLTVANTFGVNFKNSIGSSGNAIGMLAGDNLSVGDATFSQTLRLRWGGNITMETGLAGANSVKATILASGCFGIGTAVDCGSPGILNLLTGVRIANAATSGNYLRGNGTNFVSSAIQASDLPGSFSGFANPTGTVGLTVVNGVLTTALRSDAAPPLSQAIAPTWTGTHIFSNTTAFKISGTGLVNFSNLSQNVVQLQGEGNSRTTSFHLNPGSGTPATGTVAEFVVGQTNSQAFGGNYGRWSFSCLDQATYGNQCGLIGEYGGTWTPGPFAMQMGIENPIGVFTVYGYIKFITVDGGAEDVQAGAIQFGANQPTPGTKSNRIVLLKPNIGGAGQYDSDAILWEGKANDGTERAVWWRQWIDVTSNAGASQFIWGQNLNGGGWTTRMNLTDTGFLGLGLGATTPLTTIHAQVTSGFAGFFANSAALSATSGGGVAAFTTLIPTAADQRLSAYIGGYHNGTNLRQAASMEAFSNQAWTDGTAQGTYLVFKTTPNGSATKAEVLRLAANGDSTFTGSNLTLTGSDTRLYVNDTSGSNQALIGFQNNGTSKWFIGKSSSSDNFIIFSNVAGATAINITAANNNVNLSSLLNVSVKGQFSTFGDTTQTASGGLNGFSILPYTDGNNYFDFKVQTGGSTIFRTGANTETGGTRNWMTVAGSTGIVTFPQSVNVTGNISSTAGYVSALANGSTGGFRFGSTIIIAYLDGGAGATYTGINSPDGVNGFYVGNATASNANFYSADTHTFRKRDGTAAGTVLMQDNLTVSKTTNGGLTSTISNPNAGASAYAQLTISSDTPAFSIQVASVAAGNVVSLISNTTANIYTTTATSLNLGANNNASRLIISAGGAVTINQTLTISGIGSDATHTDSTVCQDTTTHLLLSGTGALGICLGTSGKQFKTDLSPMKAGLSELMGIDFVNYRYIPGYGDNGERRQYGATAQNVAAALPDLAGYDTKGEIINYDWGALLFVGLRAIQQLKADNDDLRMKLKQQESR